jgi:hypothetical protein
MDQNTIALTPWYRQTRSYLIAIAGTLIRSVGLWNNVAEIVAYQLRRLCNEEQRER